MSNNKFQLTSLDNFKGRSGPYLLIVMDGVGIGDHGPGDAVFQAKPKNLNQWIRDGEKNKTYCQIKAHGISVGLPNDESMGNSEIGHNTLGAGLSYSQRAKLINDLIETNGLFDNAEWNALIDKLTSTNSALHFIGLLSDGYIHTHVNQLYALLDKAAASGVKKLRVHALLDGRDVPPDSSIKYINELDEKLKQIEKKYSVDAKIAAGGGRMHITMDRYGSDWDMVERGWNLHVYGKVPEEDINLEKGYSGYFSTAQDAINAAYGDLGVTEDQYHPTFVVVDDNNEPIGKMHDGDGIINFNFRGDRALEITQAFVIDDFSQFDRAQYGKKPVVNYVGLMQYDGEAELPKHYLAAPPTIQDVSSEYFCAMGIKSYAIAETHKFGHVTYFWNGNRSGYIDEKLEVFKEITSLSNKQTESHPTMKAHEVTVHLLEAIRSDKYKYLRCNYANGDMVGHTGNIEAAKKAVLAVDESMEQVVSAVLEKDGVVVITADHGNCDEMLTPQGKKVTSHSINPVPFIILDSGFSGEYQIDSCDFDTENGEVPGLQNVMPTFFNLMGYESPKNYAKSLIKFK